jgi:hypothetical protein
MRPSGREDFFPLIVENSQSVEEVAGEQNAGNEHQEQPKIKAGTVELDWQIVGIGIALHGENQRRMNCMAASAPRKNTVGMPRA